MALPVVDKDLCNACGICADECPSGCFEIEDIAVLANPDSCDECGTCVESCASEAIAL